MFVFRCQFNTMWTDDLIEKLIELYKENPILWDVRHENYKNRFKRHETLKNISQILKIEVVEVERKLNVLLTQFRRTHKKAVSMRKSGIGPEEIDNSIWYGYKMMPFLKIRFTENTETGTKEEDSHDELLDVYSTDNGPTKRQRSLIMGQLQQKQKFTDKQADINEDEICQIRDVSKNTADIDEYDLFGQQIALKLKKMDDYMRIETQHKINCVLYDAETKIMKQQHGFLRNTKETNSPNN